MRVPRQTQAHNGRGAGVKDNGREEESALFLLTESTGFGGHLPWATPPLASALLALCRCAVPLTALKIFVERLWIILSYT